ncbi:phosphoribosylamine--glycine ligase [Anaerorhabdus sp.]|uniref:phosphoribosylamine--glycine ligase n=1 Tax=Anaerorhabdus sp. TaxID=1872524 RepID=UPI002FC92034
MKKILVIGSGGREHAIAYKFKQSPQVEEVFVAPGNPGMSDVATIVPIETNDFVQLIQLVKDNQIDLTFVGPEIPLCAGIVDEFHKEGLAVFGPTQAAAELEGSKVFSKAMMKKYNIPTAKYESFSDYEEAKKYLLQQTMPIVLKADGLAAGKGVIIAMTMDEALQSLEEMMCNHLFADAGSSVVIEEYLEGEEFSLLAFVNGNLVVPMQIAQDHKRAFDNDEGLNTGGMGAYTPVHHIPESAYNEAVENIVQAMADAMVMEGKPFLGILYGGCMLTKDGVKTIEYNVRFGDPETEVILPALENDLVDVVENTMKGIYTPLTWSKDSYCGVVMANKGYPESYNKGAIIDGLDKCNATVFHMGTAMKDGNMIATGGRVLFVVKNGQTLKEAQDAVYKEIVNIECDSLFYRHDIGSKGIK